MRFKNWKELVVILLVWTALMFALVDFTGRVLKSTVTGCASTHGKMTYVLGVPAVCTHE